MPTLFLIALLSPATWGDTLLPERFSAKFTLSNNGTRLGETHWTLNPIDGQKYLFESTSRTTGIWSLLSSGERVERSIWTRHDGNLRPLSYQYRRTDKESKNVDIVFNWEQGTSLATRKGHTR
ncbi:MAG: DUF3108 domain-containing protein, partial [Gammaproteobacteria bacterium]|nr:DUF3108 domain-containing protein [Gammaproteobacteria bacterium]